MKKKLSLLLFAMVCMCGLFFTPTKVQAATKYYVTTKAVNMRKGPGTKYQVKIELPKEAALKVTNTSNSKWYKVEYQNSAQKKFTGYVSSTYLKKATFYKVTGDLYLRKTASASGKKVVVLPKKAKIIVVNTQNGKWYKSVYYAPNGKVYRGYASKNYLKAVNSATGKTYVATGDVYMRAAASGSSEVIVTVRKGKTVTVTGTSGKWFKCTYKAPSGKTYTGYVSSNMLKQK